MTKKLAKIFDRNELADKFIVVKNIGGVGGVEEVGAQGGWV